jgi:3-methyladenine DNA glycosylase/8-oxoguanine DNA glycosylase
MSFTLPCPDRYDLLSSVHSWIYPDVQPVPEVTGSGFFGRSYLVRGQRVDVVLEQAEPGSPMEVSFAPSDFPETRLRGFLRHVLGLRVDTSAALSAIAEDNRISRVLPGVDGIRPYHSPTAFEALFKTVIQQQVSYRAANVITRRIVEALAPPLHFKGLELHLFPDSVSVLNLGSEGLRALGLGYKADYLLTVCEMEQRGDLKSEALRAMSYEELFRYLKPIRGIGEWTIQTLSIAGLGNFKVFPYGDLGVRNLLGRLYGHGTRLTTREVREKTKDWRDGSLVLYLLMCADVLGLFQNEGRPTTIKRSALKEIDGQ